MSILTDAGPRRLLVTRRDPETGTYESVGELSRDETGFAFFYYQGVERALPGMRDLERVHRSSDLFPLFEHRVVSPRREDHDKYLSELALEPGAAPFEVLARSGGRSAVDTLELTPMPQPGPVDILFLVHGIRYLDERQQARVDALHDGQDLGLVADPYNPHDHRAVLVTRENHKLGFVPGPLLEAVHIVMKSSYRLRVERVNPPEAGFHMRLLVRLTGTLEEDCRGAPGLPSESSA